LNQIIIKCFMKTKKVIPLKKQFFDVLSLSGLQKIVGGKMPPPEDGGPHPRPHDPDPEPQPMPGGA
jgi:hypothetical protein